VPLFLPQRLDVPVREGLGTGGPARFQDRRQEAEQLNSRRSRHHVLDRGEPSYVPSEAASVPSRSRLGHPGDLAGGVGKRDV